jgi:hypothetical protein
VLVVDNLSMGPYSVADLWEAQASSGAAAGNYSYIVLRNDGPPGAVIVLERFQFRASAASNLNWNVGLDRSTFGGSYSAVTRRATEIESAVVGAATPFRLGDVMLAAYQDPNGALISTVNNGGFWYSDALPHDALGPWIIGSGQTMALRPDAVNIGLNVYMLGRYYPAP